MTIRFHIHRKDFRDERTELFPLSGFFENRVQVCSMFFHPWKGQRIKLGYKTWILEIIKSIYYKI